MLLVEIFWLFAKNETHAIHAAYMWMGIEDIFAKLSIKSTENWNENEEFSWLSCDLNQTIRYPAVDSGGVSLFQSECFWSELLYIRHK